MIIQYIQRREMWRPWQLINMYLGTNPAERHTVSYTCTCLEDLSTLKGLTSKRCRRRSPASRSISSAGALRHGEGLYSRRQIANAIGLLWIGGHARMRESRAPPISSISQTPLTTEKAQFSIYIFKISMGEIMTAFMKASERTLDTILFFWQVRVRRH